MVHAFKMRHKQLCIRCSCSNFYHIFIVHNNASTQVKTIATCIKGDNLGAKTLQIAFDTSIPDGISSVIERLFLWMSEYITRRMSGRILHDEITMLAFGLLYAHFPNPCIVADNFHIIKSMRHHHLPIVFVLHKKSHIFRYHFIGRLIDMVIV